MSALCLTPEALTPEAGPPENTSHSGGRASGEHCWIALRKEPVENSLSKDWPEQQVVVKEPMVIPNVAEVVWALTTYKAVRDIYLLENIYVCTNSVDSDGERMYIGHFNTDGLRVSNCWDYNRGYDLGVSASRKF
jgi:hypothetical protein